MERRVSEAETASSPKTESVNADEVIDVVKSRKPRSSIYFNVVDVLPEQALGLVLGVLSPSVTFVSSPDLGTELLEIASTHPVPM